VLFKNSWKLKRQFDLIFSRIDEFFDKESITSDDEITFGFGKKTYTAVTKVLLLSSQRANLQVQ
jgi:hypothetical protein